MDFLSDLFAVFLLKLPQSHMKMSARHTVGACAMDRKVSIAAAFRANNGNLCRLLVNGLSAHCIQWLLCRCGRFSLIVMRVKGRPCPFSFFIFRPIVTERKQTE